MEKINSFSDLYSKDYNFFSVCAMNQNWSDKATFVMDKPRPTNAILLFVGCSAVFNELSGRKTINVPKGSLFFLPASSQYKWTFYRDNTHEISTMLFEFMIIDSSGKQIQICEEAGIIDISASKRTEILFKNLISEFSKPAFSIPKAKAVAHYLLSEIAEDGMKKRILEAKTELIYKGIKYLDEDPKQEKSISEIAAMCNVSINYFERLFKEYAKCTPAKYRLQRKIDKAKFMLAFDTITVEQISQELYFDDCAYFCRIFKKMCNCTPTQYRKLNRNVAPS